MGKMMWEYANGIDNSEVESERGNPKSISTSVVLPYDYTNIDEIKKVLMELSKDTGRRLRNKKMYASNVSIWIKYHDFTKISKQNVLYNMINSDNDIYNEAIKLFDKIYNPDSDKKVRSLCVGVANLSDRYKVQLSLIDNNIDQKENSIDDELKKTLNDIKKKYGDKSITYADRIDK